MVTTNKDAIARAREIVKKGQIQGKIDADERDKKIRKFYPAGPLSPMKYSVYHPSTERLKTGSGRKRRRKSRKKRRKSRKKRRKSRKKRRKSRRSH